jgi:putative phosphoesterase
MLIGVLSDTHDRLPAIDAALRLFADRAVRAVIHAGDFVAPFAVQRLRQYCGPLHAIYGNNDGERKILKKLIPRVQNGPLFIKYAGRVILVNHSIDQCSPDDIERADIIITGHTHEAVNRIERRKLFLNPGECCGWVNGKCTAAILETAGPLAKIYELEVR